MYSGPHIAKQGLVYGYDSSYGLDTNGIATRFYAGEPTSNLVPTPTANASFTTSNGWGTYNTNQYNSNTYFSIGTVGSVSNNIVTLSSTGRNIRSFDVLKPQTTGGGVTAGTNYVIKKLSSTTFSLHAYNSSQNGSQGYINPSTGFYKVHDDYANDTRISINATSFPTMWWGGPHLPNSGLIKEIVEGGGRRPGTNCMRWHVYRGDGVADGMAYGVYTPVTQGDTITVSYWLRAATPSAANKTGTYTTYFGSGNSAFSQGFSCGEYLEWKHVVHQWTASVTYNFYQYWFPQGSTDKYDMDIADLQVEVNRGHSTPFVAGTRSSTESLLNLAGNDYGTLNVANVSFDSNAQPTFDGTDDYINKDRKQYAITEDWSVELVFKPTDDNDTSWNGLFGGYLGGGGYWMFHSSGNLTYYEGYSGSSKITYRSWTKANTFVQDQYHHLVITYTSTSSTAGTFNLYYNGGEKTDSFNWTFTFSHSLDSNFIGVGDLSRYGTNDVHVYREYNRVLSPIEIATNYKAYKERFSL